VVAWRRPFAAPAAHTRRGAHVRGGVRWAAPTAVVTLVLLENVGVAAASALGGRACRRVGVRLCTRGGGCGARREGCVRTASGSTTAEAGAKRQPPPRSQRLYPPGA
jgi:hypothetical protein